MVTYVLHWSAYSPCIYISYQVSLLVSHTSVEWKEQSKNRLKRENIRAGVKTVWAARNVLLGIRVHLLSSCQQRPKTLRQSPTYVGYYASYHKKWSLLSENHRLLDWGVGGLIVYPPLPCQTFKPFIFPVKWFSHLCFNPHGNGNMLYSDSEFFNRIEKE